MNDNRCALFRDAVQQHNFSSVMDAVDVKLGWLILVILSTLTITVFFLLGTNQYPTKNLSKPWIDRFVKGEIRKEIVI